MRRCCSLLGFALLAAACTTDPVDGVDLTISVRKAPIAPVEMPGVDNSAPVDGAEVRVLQDMARMRVMHTGRDGLVTTVLEAGTYQVRVVTCPGTVALPPPATVTLSTDGPDQVALTCDTGIR